MRGVAALSIFLSGCCCGGGLVSSSGSSQWDDAVRREKANRQSYAMNAGTANVFRVEVFEDGGTEVVDSAEFTVLWPQPMQIFDPSMPSTHGGELHAFGRLPIDAQSVDEKMLLDGHDLGGGYFRFGGYDAKEELSLEVLDGRHAVLRLKQSCPAVVKEHHDPRFKRTQGIINIPIPQDGEDVWYGLQSAPCARATKHPAP